LTTGPTFSKHLCGWKGQLTPEQTGTLVDEQFGRAILRDARNKEYITSCPAEKSCATPC
jgi:hypothetical protein